MPLLEEKALLTFLPDIRWACGFTGSNAVLVAGKEGSHLVTDGRYREQAALEVREADVHVTSGDLLDYVGEAGLLGDEQQVRFQPEHLSYAQYRTLTERFPAVEWLPAEKLLVHRVASKRPDEIDAIRRAQRITEEVFAHLTTYIRPGMTEREVAAEVVYRHLHRGAERMSFDPIVASGPNSALPHARPTDRRISRGDALVLDFGCVVDGYASDMTRTVVVGAPPDGFEPVYRLVRAAQEAAVAAARSGIPARRLDGAARDVIAAAGYAEAFSHGLGHGIGLQTHEWPRVSFQVEDELPAGAVVTIEPGVYLPGRFGVRIEDMVVLRPDGAENLTAATRDLLVL